MKLYDRIYGHEVGTVQCDEICSRHGDRFKIEGYAVVDTDGLVGTPDEAVGSFDGHSFFNRQRQLMAKTRVTTP